MNTLIPYRRYLGRSNNSLFNDSFFRSFFNLSDVLSPTTGFRVDIKDTGNAFTLEAELPGVQEDQINLSVEDGSLTISTDINSEKKDEKEGYYYCERRSGHVERSFNVEGIREENITASYKNGILTVTLPKKEPQPEKTARRIEIGVNKEALQQPEETK